MSKEIFITSMNEIEPTHLNVHEPYEYFSHDVTDGKEKYQITESKTVVAFYTLPPGKSNFPMHWHMANEEVFYVISGSGILETPSGNRPIKAGDVIICPTGEAGAHKLTNNSEAENLVYLDVDTNNTPDIVYYPNSDKMGLRANNTYKTFPLNSHVEYYHGE